MDNPHSIMVSMDTLGYAFLSISVLFSSMVFMKSTLERATSWLLRITGIVGLVGVFGFAVNNDALRLGVIASGVPFLLATILLSVLFYKWLRSGNFEGATSS